MVARTIVQSRRLYPDDRASCSADPLPMRYNLSEKKRSLEGQGSHLPQKTEEGRSKRWSIRKGYLENDK